MGYIELRYTHFKVIRNLDTSEYLSLNLTYRLYNDNGDNNLSTKSYVDLLYHCWFGNDRARIRKINRNYPVTREVTGQEAQLVISVAAHCKRYSLSLTSYCFLSYDVFTNPFTANTNMYSFCSTALNLP